VAFLAQPLHLRRPLENDRRRVLALLNPRGRTVYRSLRQTVEQQECELSALLDGDARELRTLLAGANQWLP
jgi:DNA-binding MarR family transcriptional regulator